MKSLLIVSAFTLISAFCMAQSSGRDTGTREKTRVTKSSVSKTNASKVSKGKKRSAARSKVRMANPNAPTPLYADQSFEVVNDPAAVNAADTTGTIERTTGRKYKKSTSTRRD